LFGLPLAQHLKKLGWRVKGSKQSLADAQRLHRLGIEAYPFSFSEKIYIAYLLIHNALYLKYKWIILFKTKASSIFS
jgi:hypothetical protein